MLQKIVAFMTKCFASDHLFQIFVWRYLHPKIKRSGEVHRKKGSRGLCGESSYHTQTYPPKHLAINKVT